MEKKGGAPWTFKEIPKELIYLINKEKIKPCKVLDVGCGESYYSIYLASKGFKVTAIDNSRKALKYARQHAKKAKVKCRFILMNYKNKNLNKFKEKFDFIFDWRFLHLIINEKERENYLD